MMFELNDSHATNYAAIVLAAGLSKRMGDVNKLLLEFQGQSLLRQSVVVLKESGIGEVVVVLGHECDRSQRQLDDLDVAQVVNSEYSKGQMSSVHCGLTSLSGESKAVFICLADQPLIEVAHLQKLIREFECMPDGKQIVVPVFQNERGNPVVLSDAVRRQVLQNDEHPGCRQFIDTHPELVNWVNVEDEAFVKDIDTPEEYARLNEQHSTTKNSQY